MRAVLHLKNTNLSWNIVRNHFKTYGTSMNSTSALPSNSKLITSTSKTCEWPDSRLGSFNKSNVAFPLPGNINTLDKFSETPAVSNTANESEYLFYDRLTEQLNVIEQIRDDDFERLISSSVEPLECTVHSCLQPLRRELGDLFPGRDISSKNSVLSVLCLNHHTRENMSTWDKSVAQERELLAHLFIESAKDICQSLNDCGYWADFIDPYSGTPFAGAHTNNTLFETDPRMRHFGLQVLDLGCCKVLSHPQWRENVFSGLIFTDAPVDHPVLSSLGREVSTTVNTQ